jgi:hypothetical protein
MTTARRKEALSALRSPPKSLQLDRRLVRRNDTRPRSAPMSAKMTFEYSGAGLSLEYAAQLSYKIVSSLIVEVQAFNSLKCGCHPCRLLFIEHLANLYRRGGR